jgi:hypothetical protein
MTETTIQGHRVRLLAVRSAPGVVLDIWEDSDQPVGSVFRVGVVAVVTDGSDGTRNPFLPWGAMYAVAYAAQPDPDPVKRFLEALRQERERAAERLGGPSTSSR